jgi:TctA family transporter
MAPILTRESRLAGLIATVCGVFLSTVGADLTTGYPRFSFGDPDSMGGIGFIPVMIGLFGILGDTITAFVLGAMMMYGLTPGPLVFENERFLVNQIFSIGLVWHVYLEPTNLHLVPVVTPSLARPPGYTR